MLEKDPLKKLPNIGEKLAVDIRAVGINNHEELKKVGSVEAVLRMKRSDRGSCYSRLYALEGAIRKIRWQYLPYSKKSGLKRRFDEAVRKQNKSKKND